MMATIGELASFITSGSRGWAKYYSTKGTLFLRIQNVRNGSLELDDVVYVEPPDSQEARRTKVQAGDLLLSITADLGRTAVVPDGLGAAHINQHLAIIRLCGVDPHFVSKYLGSPDGQHQFEKLNREGVKAGLNFNDIRSLQIPRPPLAEQKRIAAILDAADALRAKRRESLAQLDTLLQSTFLDMFGDPVTNPMGWEETTLPEISTKLTDGPFGSNLKSSHYVAEGVRVIRLQNIGVGEILDDDLAFISNDHFASLQRNHCKPGDVIIATLGDPNLRACIIPSTLKNSLNKADCMLMRVNVEKADAVYVCWLLNCPGTVTKALRLVRGQTRGRISLGRLNELQVPLPPLNLQRRFAAIVESVKQQKTHQRTHLAELDSLFASLQSRAFRGEL